MSCIAGQLDGVRLGRVTFEEAAVSVASAAVESEPTLTDLSARVFKIIRISMPVSTLFRPELKINIASFIKDQIFFQKIARFIAPLGALPEIDSVVVANQFKGSELEKEILSLFKFRQEEYLALFFQACSDALNNIPFETKLQPAIEGRIFTLNNALVAQLNPETIPGSLPDLITSQVCRH